MKKNQNITITLTGKNGTSFSTYLSQQVIQALKIDKLSKEEQSLKIAAVKGFLKAMSPANELEALLLVNAFACQDMAMSLMQKSFAERNYYDQELCLKYSCKFMKNFTQLIGSLNSHRSQSEKT